MSTVKTLKETAPAKDRNSRDSGIQLIARAAQILRALGDSTGLSLAGIAENVGLARSTVHRIVLALEAERLVSCNGPGQYRLGPEILHLAEACKLDLFRDVHPYIVRLSRELDETVDLSVRAGHLVTVVDQAIAMRRLRVEAALGRSFPLYCTASGKAILAALPDEMGQALISGPLETFTSKTVASRAELQKQIAEVRRVGVAYDIEELSVGLCAIGSCLNLGNGDVIAVSVPVPAGRFYGQEDHFARTLSRFLTEIANSFPTVTRVFPDYATVASGRLESQ
ncbi:MAG: IclR family transcriptional regulator [Acidobacteriota bacterium]